MIPQFIEGTSNNISFRNQPHLITAVQNANIFDKSFESFIINDKEVIIEVYKSKVGVAQNSVFEKEFGPIFYLKQESEFTDEERIFFLNMFDKVRGKRKVI